jgi:phosphoribosylformylglycinamidine synthase I
MKGKVAVIMFPGNNCEEETARACRNAGMSADIVRWNTKDDLGSYDGFVLPGGWSYEDRIRAGVIASKDSVMNIVKREADKDKPVLGICNGAQVLVESGMVPGVKDELQMALASNMNPFVSGFYCTWVRIRNVSASGRCAFTRNMEKGDVMRIPIAHAEGRFTTREAGLVRRLEDSGQVIFKYCGPDGNVARGFPGNPNGSVSAIAGICNPRGNVLAMMPHPERASWNGQVPGFEGGTFDDMTAPGPCRRIFASMADYIGKEGNRWR